MALKEKAISGVKWTSTSTITLAVTNLIKIAVLARFLDKSDFGLMALVTFVLGFMNLFMDMGLTTAILHKQIITKQEYASLYWINVLFSVFLVGVISALTPFIASFYNESELSLLIPLMSLSLVISALGKQFRTIEEKQLHFKYVSIVDIISVISGLIVSIVLAVLDQGVYALVFGSLTIHFIANIIFFVSGLKNYGMLIHFNYADTKPFLSIGIYQVGGQIINYFNRDLDVLLLGKLFGTEILGGYSLAKQLVRMPLQIIDPIVTKVGISVFPKFQSDHQKLRGYFLRLLNAKGSVNAFTYGTIAITAPYLVQIFYGREFVSIIPYVQLFTLLVYLRSMAGVVGILVITKGRTDYDFYWNLMTTLLMPLAIFIGASYSVNLTIVMMGLVQLLLLIPGWYMFYKRLINLDLISFLKVNLVPLIIGSIVVVISILFYSNNIIIEILMTIGLFIALITYTYFSIDESKALIKKLKKKYVRI